MYVVCRIRLYYQQSIERQLHAHREIDEGTAAAYALKIWGGGRGTILSVERDNTGQLKLFIYVFITL